MTIQPNSSPLYRFRKIQRIALQRDFDHLFQNGKRCTLQGWVTLSSKRTLSQLPRCGIKIGRNFGNAVQRNQMKRWIREVFRQSQQNLIAGSEIVFWIRSVWPDADYKQVETQALHLMQKTGLWKEN